MRDIKTFSNLYDLINYAEDIMGFLGIAKAWAIAPIDEIGSYPEGDFFIRYTSGDESVMEDFYNMCDEVLTKIGPLKMLEGLSEQSRVDFSQGNDHYVASINRAPSS